MEYDLIDVRWHYDEQLGEWVLVANEAPPRGEGSEPVTHWLKDTKEEPE